jgi:hypothetical protein
LALLQARQRRKAFLAGRGGGKTFVAGHHFLDCAGHLPRAKFFLLGITYNQIQSIFLPPMIRAWESRGIIENEHYVIGKRCPVGFDNPYEPPKNYENVITFFNGFTIVMISFDRPNANRGSNFDGGVVDEAVLINKERYDKEIKPTIRGNNYVYPDVHYHHSELFLSSQSWTIAGDWFPDLELEAKENPDETFFIEGNAYDNIDILGERYIKDLEKDLPLLIFQVEILNMRRKKIPNCFYDELNEEKHCYIDTYSYDYNDTGLLVTKTDHADYNRELPLEVSFDFNAAFNSCIIGQEVHKGHTVEARIINNLFVKNKVIKYLVDKIIEQYRGHKNIIMIWGDRNGNNKTADSELTFYDQIEKQLKDAKFVTRLMVKDRLDPYHALKHTVINTLLAEIDNKLPRIRFNKNKCKPTILSMQAAPVTGDFKKDKSSERNPALPQEKATHLSDAFDNWIYPKYHHLVESMPVNYRVRILGPR